MKTIFIPIMGRLQARNILRTDVFKVLNEDPHIRLVILAPSLKVGEHAKEFHGDNLVFEGFGELPRHISAIDFFFYRLSLFYINSPTGRALRKEWLYHGLHEKKSPFRYGVSISLLYIFGGSSFLRALCRFLDYHLIKDDRYAAFFDKYKPDLVFSPRIDSALDRSFLRHAKKRKIKTVGMISSWDNISYAKYPFRVLPDTLIVHNELIKQEAVRYLDMPEKHIMVTGMPHFDHYVTSRRISRKEFCKRVGIQDHTNRIILFASVGWENPTEWQDLKLLDESIEKGELPKDLVIIFRLHPSLNNDIDMTQYSKHVVFDDSKTMVKNTHTHTEILEKDMNHLADSLHHADITINSCSTMSIDAAAFDKPIVNIAYDGWEKFPFHKSIAKAYTPARVHFQSIVKSKGTRIVYSHDDLLACIIQYFKNPERDREGRKRIVEEQCYKLDGHAGKRVGEYILSRLS